jgi:hypothetical protein
MYGVCIPDCVEHFVAEDFFFEKEERLRMQKKKKR